MAEKLKYRINDQIALLPRSITMSDLEKALRKLGIPPSTFYRDRHMTEKSGQSISVDRLLIYAKFFECSIDALINDDGALKIIGIRKQVLKSMRKIKNQLS